MVTLTPILATFSVFITALVSSVAPGRTNCTASVLLKTGSFLVDIHFLEDAAVQEVSGDKKLTVSSNIRV